MKNEIVKIENKQCNINVFMLPNTNVFNFEVKFNMGSNMERFHEDKPFGITHLIEHLSFKSPRDYNTKEFNDLMDKHGKRNASTSFEETKFFMKSTTEHLYEAINLTTNAAFNNLTKVTKEEFENERGVVLKEIDEYSENHKSTYSYLRAISIVQSNELLTDTILGSKEIVANLTLEDVIEYKKEMLNTKPTFNIVLDPVEVEAHTIVENVKSLMRELNKELPKSKTSKVLLRDPIKLNEALNLDVDVCDNVQYCTDYDLGDTNNVIIFIDGVKDVGAKLLLEKYLDKNDSGHSFFDNLREKNNLCYSYNFSGQRIRDVQLSVFNATVTKGKENDLIREFKNAIIDSFECLTEEAFLELKEKLKIEITHSSLNLNSNLFLIDIDETDEYMFDTYEDIIKNSPNTYFSSIIENVSYEEFVLNFKVYLESLESATYVSSSEFELER